MIFSLANTSSCNYNSLKELNTNTCKILKLLVISILDIYNLSDTKLLIVSSLSINIF